MTLAPHTSFAPRAIKPAIGGLVVADKALLLSGERAADIRTALEARGVLVFPQIHFTDAEQIAFTRTLGEYAPDRTDGAVTSISLDPLAGANADYTRASLFWHFDGYMNETPILASLMSARVLSPTGGDTEFCNTYAAYEALPEERKQRIAGLKAVHALAAAQLAVEPEPSAARFAEWRKLRERVLPLVWKHRSGRKSLVIGNTAAGILGMNPLESLELLIWLRDWATRERFAYSHRWRVGDAVLWDNTGTLHRVTPYPADSGRLMHRTKLAGEEPLE